MTRHRRFGVGSRDAGGATVLGLVAITVVLAATAATVGFGTALVAAARARAAADLAALAAATAAWSGPTRACGLAARVASGSGARLTDCDAEPDGVFRVAVAVRVGLAGLRQAAHAVARAGPGPPG